MKVLVFSRGLGMGHITRDLEIIKELRQANPRVRPIFCSYSSGFEFVSKMGYNAFDLDIKATPFYPSTFTESLLKGYRIIVKFRPTLLVSDEEFYVPVLGKMLNIPSCFITNWFPDEKDILGLSCLELSDSILFPDLPGTVETPKALSHKTVFVGPLLSSSLLERTKTMKNKKDLRKTIGLRRYQNLILVTRGRMWIDPGFMNVCAKSFEEIHKTFSDTGMIIVSGKEVSKEEILDGVNDKEAIKIYEFIEDMITYMASSDIAITEGYSTLWELASVGTPVIAVSFPLHITQERFAQAMQKRGTAIWIPRKDLSAEMLTEKLALLLSNETYRLRMSHIGRNLCRKSGAKKAVDVILDILRRAVN